MSVVEELHRAREAYERQEWVTAYRALSDLDDTELAAGDFAALSEAAKARNDPVGYLAGLIAARK